MGLVSSLMISTSFVFVYRTNPVKYTFVNGFIGIFITCYDHSRYPEKQNMDQLLNHWLDNNI
jgi:hypothetical protein